MVARSAGLLVYRLAEGGDADGGADGADLVEVLLVHPGGPFWAHRDDGVWSVPKGEYGPEEDAFAVAHREFSEETGLVAPEGEALPLGEVRQAGGKRVVGWALEGDLDVTGAASNTFELEWPRGSGRVREFPEVDRIEWFTVTVARAKLLEGQRPFLDALMAALAGRGAGGGDGTG
jgi:predicted NUDIX family NTP pyrophosphohydrolase